MGHTRFSWVGIALFCVSTSTFAQGQAGQGQVVTTPINNWSYQHHASTATEGVLNGQARVVQAVGQATYLNSIAAVNQQEAYRRWIENRKLYVKTYYENKEINREYREKYSSKPPTKERWARITASALPDRLSGEQYDAVTGRLVWPHVLRTDEYKAIRDRIDELLVTRTPENSGDGSPFQREIASLVGGMKMLLKDNIDTLSTSQYGNAKGFLESLAYEAELPMGTPADAIVAADDSTVNEL